MTPERWRQVSQIYHDALVHDAAERGAFLHEACGNDEALRQEVESLLAEPASANDLLAAPALAMAAGLVDDPAEPTLTGQQLGTYQILELLGVGGMGQVYRARDTRLGRDVAIKVLPRLFSADPERLARFDREARLLASVNHPHIAAIYGFEQTGGVHALVLELVEGPTLGERLQRGPLPIPEALSIARQIADALEAAHERQIVHRDLKPQNIKVKPDGTVKVLDFGLAKAAIAANDAGASRTATPVDGTRDGIILGTISYMSPEQSRGHAVDKRTDIWAFGCVLYEMLTGRALFAAETLSDTLAAVLKQEPDWEELPTDTSAGIRSLLRRCLKRDPVDRLHDIADARIEIQDAIAESATPTAAARHSPAARWMRVLPWIVAAGAVTIALLVLLQGWRATGATTASVMRLDLDLPSGVELVTVYPPAVVLSPDGTRVAFVGAFRGIRQLYTRRLDQFETVPIRGTENANAVFMSPDGRSLGFITADLSLKRVSLADGLVTTIDYDAEFSAGAAWGADDRITFVRAGALWQVPASGGTAKQLTTLDRGAKQEILHAWPTVIAQGRILLFVCITGSSRGASHIEALSLATGERRVVVESGTFPLVAASGQLVFFRDGALLAAPFDLDRVAVTGPVVRVLENLAVGTTMDAPFAALSNAGSLAYAPSNAGTTRLVWVSRQGVEQPITDTARRYQYPRLASDGRRTVVAADGDLWIQDNARATFTRLTSEQTVGNAFPVWTPDGTRVLFRTLTGMYSTAADGSGHPRAIAGSLSGDFPCSVSPDGDTLAFMRQNAGTSRDIYVLSLRGQFPPRPLVNTPGYDGGAQVSPDGHWMAYASNESGQMQVYVRPFPGSDRRWQVSAQGGTQPVWSRNGKEIFYRLENKMMVVDVAPGVDITLSQPRQLFEQRYVFQNISLPNYDVSPDGERFVMVKDEAGSGRLNVVLNWTEELKRLAVTH